MLAPTSPPEPTTTPDPLTPEQVDQIIQHWSTTFDTWQGDKGPVLSFDYPHELLKAERKTNYTFRELPDYRREQALAYIAVVCRRYPLQLRAGLGMPMWLRFTDTWDRCGDVARAMRAI